MIELNKGFVEMDDLNKLNIVCFDGVCGICNEWVDLLISKDSKRVLRYCPLQDSKIRPYIVQFGMDPLKLDTIIFLKKGEVFIKSDAVFEIMKEINFFSWAVPLLSLCPKAFRNIVYDLVAKNRYKIMPKKENCRVPTKEEKDLFV
ncbi:MAG: thiol-disulfide oxidoreductase [Halobacteriovoraceae bacterium]|nr:thiol-disulfide oxidoreductase [Halobacteriovoraceae bacterium]|tara:strand:- start:358 stop:795 length:438 start_codon:yes stop_codon:yes gene_type:complete